MAKSTAVIQASLFERWSTVVTDAKALNKIIIFKGETFVTRKITRSVARISLGLQDKLFMGNINSKRDWGHARDYVEGMYPMLQQEKPEDFVLATGVTKEIKEFIRMAFGEAGMDLEFRGEGIDEKAFTASITGDEKASVGQEVMSIDPKYFRPTEVELLIGDSTKAKEKLGWKPRYTVQELCREMVLADIELFKKDYLLKEAGYTMKNEYE